MINRLISYHFSINNHLNQIIKIKSLVLVSCFCFKWFLLDPDPAQLLINLDPFIFEYCFFKILFWFFGSVIDTGVESGSWLSLTHKTTHSFLTISGQKVENIFSPSFLSSCSQIAAIQENDLGIFHSVYSNYTTSRLLYENSKLFETLYRLPYLNILKFILNFIFLSFSRFNTHLYLFPIGWFEKALTKYSKEFAYISYI